MTGSFKGRFIVGSILWTSGLLGLGHMLSIFVIHHFPRLAGMQNIALAFVAFVALVLAGFAQVRRGFTPLNQLRARIADLREGRNRRLEGSYPSEVQPLVSDLNALLEERDRRVSRAIAIAGDLAHGLKTPLAILAQEADRAEAAGQLELAETIGQQVERMRRQVDYHLVHARAAGRSVSPAARCPIRDSAEALARTMRRLYADRSLTLDVDVPLAHVVRGTREDVDEMLGNLLDNACKWARSLVRVRTEERNGGITITVDDDGRGLEPSMRDAVLQRGVRADENAPGSGLGLAIVRDLAELYGGSIVLSDAPEGGVRARLHLPT